VDDFPKSRSVSATFPTTRVEDRFAARVA
jgi:hypothetical protein